jgi:transposase
LEGGCPEKARSTGTSLGGPPYSGCGAVKAKLALSERTYTCDDCGLVLDRDVNAARNLLLLAVSGRRA